MLDQTEKQAVAKIGQLRPASRALVDDLGYSRVGRDVSGGDPLTSGECWCASMPEVAEPETLKMRLLNRDSGPFALLSYIADRRSIICTIDHPMAPQASLLQ